jgi:hypothetical protein
VERETRKIRPHKLEVTQGHKGVSGTRWKVLLVDGSWQVLTLNPQQRGQSGFITPGPFCTDPKRAFSKCTDHTTDTKKGHLRRIKKKSKTLNPRHLKE